MAIDAQVLDHVLGPAAAVGVAREPLLGGEHAVAAVGRHMALEIGLVAEQAEAVLHLPVDRELAAGRLSRGRRVEIGRAGGRRSPQCQWRA